MLGINTDLPFIYSIICILLGLIYAVFLYEKDKNYTSRKLIWILFGFRTLLISIISFLLMSPIVKSNVNLIERPVVIIVKDNSRSVKEDFNVELQILEDNLHEFEVWKYSFSDEVVEGISKSNTGIRTNFSKLFSELNNKFENRNVAAIVLASDGCYNTGINPEFISYDSPVYSIALGDTNIYKDIRIDNVLINDISFLGNSFPLEISIASKLDNPENSKFTIWNKGEKVYEEIVEFSANDDYKTIKVQLTAEKVGLQTYTIELEALEGERNQSNNIFKSYIDVIDSRHNILILKGGSHPDIAAYKSVIDKNKNYNIEVKEFNEEIVIQKYQLVVLFDVDVIPPPLVEGNLPLIIFNSNQSHYNIMGSKIDFAIKGGMQDVAVSKDEDFTKFTFSSNLIQLISSAPPLNTLFGKYKKTGAIVDVLNQKVGSYISGNPIIFLHEFGPRKIAFITAEGWWRWKLFDFSINQNNEVFDELFSKLSKYVLLQDDKSLFRIEYAKQVDENSDIVMRASLYNESYELVNNKEIELQVFDTHNNEYVFQFTKRGDEYIVNAGIFEVGTYYFTAKVKNSNVIKKGSFDVKKLQLEKISLVANHQVLKKIALRSGGKLFYPDDMQSLVNTLIKSERNKKVIHAKEKLESLINIPWILLSLLFLTSVEWIVRRYNGLV